MKISFVYILILVLGAALLIFLSSCALFSHIGTQIARNGEDGGNTMYRDLTPEEERVILHRGTEMPFTGEYLDNTEEGVYTCRQCGAELYRSSDKFESHCGWPSFDDEIPGAVERRPDPDGMRTEILCSNCGGHLGHVFIGEGMTPNNTRHCVNSISLDFLPAGEETPAVTEGDSILDELISEEENQERAIFASGCFWGVEYQLKQLEGVISTTVGYTGGHTADPTYRDVCGHTTGHAEAVEVIFDPAIVSYEGLAKLFFETHDFTQVDRQGPDIGDQYRSEIFYTNDKQRGTAESLIETLTDMGYDVATRISEAGEFYPAEEYHQDYYAKNGSTPYCHAYRQIFDD